MKYVFLCALSVAGCSLFGAESVSAPAAGYLIPPIGAVEVYGARKVSIKKIRSVLGVREGSTLPGSKGALEDQLDKIPGVLASRIEAACCLEGKTVLYVGVEERGSHHFEFRPEPDADVSLPSDLTEVYSNFLDNVNQSIRLNQTGESLNLGYSLMQNPGARRDQEQFLPLVARNFETVHRVVRTSHDGEERAMAAYLLQYGPRSPRTSQEIVNDLQYALQDVDDTVRANAIRALTAMYVGSKLHPEQGVTVQPTWFVELLNSIVWSDRHNASVALADMTESRDPETLQLIRERALQSVLEMARWHDLSQALPAYILAGRLAGLSEQDIRTAWVGPDRDAVLKLAQKRKQA